MSETFSVQQIDSVRPLAAKVADPWVIGEEAHKIKKDLTDEEVSAILFEHLDRNLARSTIQEGRETFEVFPRAEDRIAGFGFSHHSVTRSAARRALGHEGKHDLDDGALAGERQWIQELLTSLEPGSSVATVDEAARLRAAGERSAGTPLPNLKVATKRASKKAAAGARRRSAGRHGSASTADADLEDPLIEPDAYLGGHVQDGAAGEPGMPGHEPAERPVFSKRAANRICSPMAA